MVTAANRKNARIENISLRLLHQETNCLTEVTIQKVQTWVRDGDNRCNKPGTLAGMTVSSNSKDIMGVAVWTRVVYRVFPSGFPVPVQNYRTNVPISITFFFLEPASDVCGGPTGPSLTSTPLADLLVVSLSQHCSSSTPCLWVAPDRGSGRDGRGWFHSHPYSSQRHLVRNQWHSCITSRRTGPDLPYSDKSLRVSRVPIF